MSTRKGSGMGSRVLVCFAFALLVSIPPQAIGQGEYAPVSDADVVALRLNHYYTADKKWHEPEYTWTFSKSEFVLKKDKGPIPTDLIEKLLPPDTKADEIRGAWKLDGKGGLVLTDIKAGKKSGKKKSDLSHLSNRANCSTCRRPPICLWGGQNKMNIRPITVGKWVAAATVIGL